MAQNLTFNLAVDTNSAVQSINQFFGAVDQNASKAKNQLNQAFGQTLQTNVEINLKNGELVAKKIQNINQESKRLTDATKAINGEWGKTPNALKRQIAILKQLQGNTQRYNSQTKKTSADWKLVTTRIQEASKALRTMTSGSGLSGLGQMMNGVVGKFALVQTLANTATAAIMGMGRAVGDFAGMAGRMETLSLQLEAFTGGAEQANAAFNEFARIAANTPFNLEEVARAGKIMMAFGVETDQAVIATEQLSVAAAATGGDINLLARNMGQIAAQGQAYTRDLTQFAIQGIPIWAEMSKVTGNTVDELKAMAADGKISFDIVSDALTNLTREGSAFAAIAERMQETFAGRMARIESSVNKLALAFIQTFNKMDRALGMIVSGSMKLFADGLMALADNMDNIAVIFGTATLAAGAFFAIQNFGAIVSGLRLVVTAIAGMVTWQNIANAALIVFNALTGNWVAIGAAIAVGGVAYAGLSAAVAGVTEEEMRLQDAVDETNTSVLEVSENEAKRAAQAGEAYKEMLGNYKEEKKLLEEKSAELEKEMEVLKALKEQVKARYDDEITLLEQIKTVQKEKFDELKRQNSEAMDATKERHSEAMKAIEAELGILRKKGPMEQKLYELNKKELKIKILKAEEGSKELLELKVRLEQLNRQEAIDAKLLEKAKLKLQQDKEITDQKKQQKAAEDEIWESLTRTNREIKGSKSNREEELAVIDDTIQGISDMQTGIQLQNKDVETQVGIVNRLAGEYETTANNVSRMADELKRAAAAQRELNSAKASQSTGAMGSNRFSGGPVAGGSTYTVNELGKEAFLSASGRLSMINAPAWGQWKAPGAGTVIPAHLTSQMSIPTGGVNVNRGASQMSQKTGAGMNVGKLASAIAASVRGDNINNNVTIQAANTTKAASDMLVSLNRVRRRRRG